MTKERSSNPEFILSPREQGIEDHPSDFAFRRRRDRTGGVPLWMIWVVLALLLPADSRGQSPTVEAAAPADVARTRYGLVPTARMLEAGSWQTGTYSIVLPFIARGVTDWFSISAGTPIFPGGAGRFWYFAPSVGTELAPGVAVGGGGIGFASLGSAATSGGRFRNVRTRTLLVWGGLTLGSDDRSFTVGGARNPNGFFLINRGGVIFAAGALTLSEEPAPERGLKLIAETILPATDGFHRGTTGAGFRFYERSFAIDATMHLYWNADGRGFSGFPFVGMNYQFGR